jgi:hypothetical protein
MPTAKQLEKLKRIKGKKLKLNIMQLTHCYNCDKLCPEKDMVYDDDERWIGKVCLECDQGSDGYYTSDDEEDSDDDAKN